MKLRLVGCVGGWCNSRECCAHYLEGKANVDIRLCGETENPMVIKEITNDMDTKPNKQERPN